MDSIDPVFHQLHRGGVAAVVTLDDPGAAVPLARALLAGGVRAIELTLRTEAAESCIEQIVAEVPEMLVGVGTILTPEQVRTAKSLGASFGVAPGLNRAVVKAARDVELPFAPGIATPSDIEAAFHLGCRVLKFFPADGMGGLKYLHGIAAPYRHLGLRYIPLGGVGPGNLGDYLASLDVLAVGGSWLAPAPLVAAGDWSGISRLAGEATAAAEKARGPHPQ